MKRVLAILCLVVFLTACSGKNEELDRAMGLRAKMLAQEVSFDTKITADYGDLTYTFSMHCQADTQGNMTFQVTEPETIAGIGGTIDTSGGNLRFDDIALAFPLLGDGHASPISSPWLMYRCLVGGMIQTIGVEKDLLRATIHDSYSNDALQFDIWLNGDNVPIRAELLYENRRIITLSIENFRIL